MRGGVESTLSIENAVRRERALVAADLHDTVCQHLTAIALFSTELDRSLATFHPVRARRWSMKIRKIVDETIGEARAIVQRLQPLSDEPGALIDALRELAESVNRQAAPRCRLTARKSIRLTDAFVSTEFHGIAQEAVHNAVTHAEAGHIDILLTERDGAVVLRIQDDGKGIDGSASNGTGMGLGLMVRRAACMDARLDVRSVPGGGTTVTCVWSRNSGDAA